MRSCRPSKAVLTSSSIRSPRSSRTFATFKTAPYSTAPVGSDCITMSTKIGLLL